MPLVQIIIILAVVGLALWAITQIPMDPTIAKVIRVVVIVCAVLWVLQLFFGVGWGNIGTMRVGHVR